MQLEQQLLYSEFQRKVFSIMTRLNLDNVIDPNLRRQLKYLSMPGPAALPREQLSRVRNPISYFKITTALCERIVFIQFNELEHKKNT